MATIVRRIEPEDHRRLRAVRLRSLEDAPYAFARTFAEEARYDDELWRERARNAASGDRSSYYLALDHDATVGMVGGYRAGTASTPDLVSMWVAPSHRGSPVATELVASVLGWARSAAYPHIELWVAADNARAVAFYRRLGFVETGDRAPLPSNPDVDEVRMRFDL